MIDIENSTIGECFSEAVKRYSDNFFLIVPPDCARDYHPGGFEITYSQAAVLIGQYCSTLQSAGYGHGHRVALLLGNRPEMLLLKLALNILGISWVPLNPDFRPEEAAYVLQDSNVELSITVPSLIAQNHSALELCNNNINEGVLDHGSLFLPEAHKQPPAIGEITPDSEASLLYTSGTTGKPKGCILSHEYELMQGAWYCSRGGLFTVREAMERIYNPLPLFHVNAATMHTFGSIVSGNCQIIPERFSRSRWWSDIQTSGATGMHYLGIVIPALLNDPETNNDKNHSLRWGLGAGVEPTLHRVFEERFGVPLIEIWGMTEMCRILVNCHEPRYTDTRAIGRAQMGLDVRVVNEIDEDVPNGKPGEMLIRYDKDTPRRGAFSGYLNLPEATEHAWRGEWFHTGDTVYRDQTGMLYFVDRNKNIIRRSGENIAAAEVEACLQAHPDVEKVAVLAVHDSMRDEEILACITTVSKMKSQSQANELFQYTKSRLAYFKAPGWIVFLSDIPVTGTQKIQKHAIFRENEDPREHPDSHDFRHLKKR